MNADDEGTSREGPSRGARRLLIQGLNYAPDQVGIPKYTTEMAEWLTARGWEVSVVTAAPYYPGWAVRPGYTARRYARETRAGVRVVRCPFYVPARPSATKRLVHLMSYALSSAPALVREAVRFRPDVVLSIAPALMAAPLSLAIARAIRRPALLHVQDFELDVAFGLGLMRGQAAQRTMTAIERAIYRGFDGVSAPSQAMVMRLIDKGCAAERVFEFRNWADTDAIRPDVPHAELRRELRIDDAQTMALYSGTLSEKQGASLLVTAARALRDDPTIRLVICGEGPARAGIEAETAGLDNVTLLPLQPVERLPALLGAADIHLLPQLAGAEDLVLPSKLSGMLSSGRPVLATVSAQSGIAREIGEAGLIVPAGDAAAFADGLRRLAGDAVMRALMGEHARRRAEESWSKEKVLGSFEARLVAVMKPRQELSGTAEHPKKSS